MNNCVDFGEKNEITKGGSALSVVIWLSKSIVKSIYYHNVIKVKLVYGKKLNGRLAPRREH